METTLGFMDAYTLWRWLPFPPNGPGKELILTHSELVSAETLHVTVVIRFVEQGIFKPSVVDVLGVLRETMLAIERIEDGATGEELQSARKQHAYAVLLYQVYRQFLELGERNS
jgi:hypothetical protein